MGTMVRLNLGPLNALTCRHRLPSTTEDGRMRVDAPLFLSLAAMPLRTRATCWLQLTRVAAASFLMLAVKSQPTCR